VAVLRNVLWTQRGNAQTGVFFAINFDWS